MYYPRPSNLTDFLKEACILAYNREEGYFNYKEAELELSKCGFPKIRLSDLVNRTDTKFQKYVIESIGICFSVKGMDLWHARFDKFYALSGSQGEQITDTGWPRYIQLGCLTSRELVMKAAISLASYTAGIAGSVEGKVRLLVSAESRDGVFDAETIPEWRETLRKFLAERNTYLTYIFRFDGNWGRLEYLASLALEIQKDHKRLEIYTFYADRETVQKNQNYYPKFVGDTIFTDYGSLDIFSTSLESNELDTAYVFDGSPAMPTSSVEHKRKLFNVWVDREKRRHNIVERRLERLINFGKDNGELIKHYSSDIALTKKRKHPNIELYERVLDLEEAANGSIIFQRGFPDKTCPDELLNETHWWNYQADYYELGKSALEKYAEQYRSIHNARMIAFNDNLEAWKRSDAESDCHIDIIPLSAFKVLYNRYRSRSRNFNTQGHSGYIYKTKLPPKRARTEIVRRLNRWIELLDKPGYGVYIIDDINVAGTASALPINISKYHSFITARNCLSGNNHKKDIVLTELFRTETDKKYAVAFESSEIAKGLRDICLDIIGERTNIAVKYCGDEADKVLERLSDVFSAGNLDLLTWEGWLRDLEEDIKGSV